MSEDQTQSQDGVTLVLGGGGFKGLAHLGVITVLEEQRIPIDLIVGSSAGSLMGGLFCVHGSAKVAGEAIVSFLASDTFAKIGFEGMPGNTAVGASGMFSRFVRGFRRQVALERMYHRSSALGGGALRHIVRTLLPSVAIEDLPVPLAVNALDLVRGEETMLRTGPLRSAVIASSSVPGYFPPVEREDLILCDPGLVDNLPTRAARALGAQRVIAVDLSADLDRLPDNDSARALMGIQVLFRTQDITTSISNRKWAEHADVVVCPPVGVRSWLDAGDPEGLIEAGRVAMEEALPQMDRLRDGTSGGAG